MEFEATFADASGLETRIAALGNVTVEERFYTEQGVRLALYGPEADLDSLKGYLSKTR